MEKDGSMDDFLALFREALSKIACFSTIEKVITHFDSDLRGKLYRIFVIESIKEEKVVQVTKHSFFNAYGRKKRESETEIAGEVYTGTQCCHISYSINTYLLLHLYVVPISHKYIELNSVKPWNIHWIKLPHGQVQGWSELRKSEFF